MIHTTKANICRKQYLHVSYPNQIDYENSLGYVTAGTAYCSTCKQHLHISFSNQSSSYTYLITIPQDLQAGPACRTCRQKLQSIFQPYTGYRERQFLHCETCRQDLHIPFPNKVRKEFQIIILQFLHRRTCRQDLHITFFIVVFRYLFDTDTAGPACRTCRQDLQQELSLPDQKAPEHQ